jgi:tetratricopeptide (TPR) repeat protein
MRGAICVALLLALGGCAKKPAIVVGPPPTAAADELVRQGCYDCLLDARSAYEQLTPRVPGAFLKLFETNVLLALREKELALDATRHLADAAALIPRLTNVAAESVLSVVKVLPEDGTARRPLPPTPDVRNQLDSATASVDAGPFSQVFKDYVKLSLRCGRLGVDPPAAGATEPPLLIYRRAICDNPIRVEPLREVRKSVPRFIETSFFLGRAEMASLFKGDGRKAGALFEEAYARFSDSPAIAFDLGTLYQATNDCRRAETFFSRTLELRPAHEEGRLGRAICRTYLSKNTDAIDDATVLIDAMASNRGEAYYWRAWNRRRLTQLDAARADIDRARTLRYNARILTLAGMIEYDQKDLDPARTDLEQARSMDNRECEAPWYLGLVEFSVENWAPSAKGFAGAAECYELLVKDSESRREEMATRKDVTEDFRTRQLAGFDAAIKEDSTQKSAADLNAAINYGRAGDLANATVYMKRANLDPQRRLAVEDLRQVLGVPRW